MQQAFPWSLTRSTRTLLTLGCATLLAVSLAACGSKKPIEVVQNGILSIDKSVTIGGALGHYQGCAEKTAKWTEGKSEKGATIVTFSCQLKDAPQIFQQRYKESLFAMTTEGLTALFQGVPFKFPKSENGDKSTEDAEALLEALLDKAHAPDEVRQTIHAAIDPYKVLAATVSIDFAMDKTDTARFDLKEVRLDVQWKDRRATLPLYIDGTLAAMYHDETVFQNAALGNDFESRLSDAWEAAEAQKPKETKL